MSHAAFDPSDPRYSANPTGRVLAETPGDYPYAPYDSHVPYDAYGRNAHGQYAVDDDLPPEVRPTPHPSRPPRNSAYLSDDFPPRRRGGSRGGSALGRLGPIGIGAIIAVLLVLFGAGAVAVSLLSDDNAPVAQAPTDELTPVEAPTEPPPPPPVAESSPSVGPSSAKPSPGFRVAVDPKAENTVVALVNRERARSGCREPVRMDDRLRLAARTHSIDMLTNNFFSHTGSDGSSPEQRMRRAGFDRPASENIARGQRSARDVMEDWMDSAPHRRNILDCEVRAIGVAVAFRSGGGSDPYWTQNFGR